MSFGLQPQLLALEEESCSWKCNLFFNEVDEGDGTRMVHDLVECLSNGWEYKFPPKYCGLAARDSLVVELKLAALCCGFCLFTRSASAKTDLSSLKSNRQAHVYLVCEQGQLHRPSKPKPTIAHQQSTLVKQKQPPKITVRKPTTPDKICPFRFTIYMTREDAQVDAGRWFLSKINIDRQTCVQL
jgi:hypothetical protein